VGVFVSPGLTGPARTNVCLWFARELSAAAAATAAAAEHVTV
jgi:hypothetical protein